jgi:hypothetical protein
MFKRIITLSLFLLTVIGGSFAQNPTKNERVAVITNRIINHETDSSCRFYNQPKPGGKLQAFAVKKDGETITCKPADNLSDMVNDLYKSGDCLVFVHGDSKTFKQAALRGLELNNIYEINVLVYAWPTRPEGENSFKNFETSKKNAEEGSEHFRNFLLMLQTLKTKCQDENHHLTLFAHSLGNYYLQQTVQDGLPAGINDSLFDNVILNAAATESFMHAEWAEKINMQKRLYITGNRYDFNLQGVRFILLGGAQLGQRFIPPFAKNALYINFSKTVGLKFYPWSAHSYFFGRATDEVPEVKTVYHNLFHGNEIELSNTKLFKKKNNKPVYWLIKQ